MSLSCKQIIKGNILTLGLLIELFSLIAEASQHRNAESDFVHSAAPEEDELLVGETRN